MAAGGRRAVEEEGFRGDLAGLSLPDVIQLEGANAFSGCVTVQHDDRVGRIFMRDGKVIHAEQDGRAGEDALADIMEWRSGRLSLEPTVSTTFHTIHKVSAQHALMDALRLVDERRAGRAPPAPPPSTPARAAAPAAAPSATPTAAGVAERVREVPGVRQAAVLDGGRVPVTPAPEARRTAARGARLAALGERLGAALRAGGLRAGVERGPAGPLVLLAGKGGYLALEVDPVADVGAVESRVRKALEPAR